MLVMYDEPFAGLDPIALAVIGQLMRKLNDALGATSIVVSHDIVEAMHIVDYLYFISDGVIMGELLDRPQFVPDLHQGDGIRAPDAEVQDYSILGPSGEPVEGPFLDDVVAKSAYMKRAQTR